MNKHTPGPWVSSQGGWIEGPNGEDVSCYAGCGSHDAEWREADLRLALSAPELLAALQMALIYHRDDDVTALHIDVSKAARAAIAKATGETP